jgi:hypothetical protein
VIKEYKRLGMIMKMNMGYTDRTVRMVGGIIILSLVPSGNVWGLIGLIPLLTGAIGICPIYSFTGMETCSADKKTKKTKAKAKK